MELPSMLVASTSILVISKYDGTKESSVLHWARMLIPRNKKKAFAKYLKIDIWQSYD
jgi:hypothetical protein